MIQEDVVMLPCPKCKSSEVGSELRCMGSFVATVCYNCGHEGTTSQSRDKAKQMWNEEMKVTDN